MGRAYILAQSLVSRIFHIYCAHLLCTIHHSSSSPSSSSSSSSSHGIEWRTTVLHTPLLTFHSGDSSSHWLKMPRWPAVICRMVTTWDRSDVVGQGSQAYCQLQEEVATTQFPIVCPCIHIPFTKSASQHVTPCPSYSPPVHTSWVGRPDGKQCRRHRADPPQHSQEAAVQTMEGGVLRVQYRPSSTLRGSSTDKGVCAKGAAPAHVHHICICFLNIHLRDVAAYLFQAAIDLLALGSVPGPSCDQARD